MRKFLCGLALALSLALSVGCDVKNMSSLKDITRPYAGEYTCRTLTYGGEDYLDRFETCVLSLKEDGSFALRFVTRDGAEGSCGGRYEYSEKTGEMTFTVRAGMREITRSFFYEDGSLHAAVNVKGKLLFAKFVP